ncbi:hypothetical protein L2E82_22829 [Cichorium intybus]|uniref:Uncharacterized protein n=1 Tax=Cichorium intybus TaxID=13427 RepID=A0ACB9DZ86_CICIN|nr:hypothetical protein L2E82_22829 [Cichorium intybus]
MSSELPTEPVISLICERLVGDLAYAITSSLLAINVVNTNASISRNVKVLSVRFVEYNTAASPAKISFRVSKTTHGFNKWNASTGSHTGKALRQHRGRWKTSFNGRNQGDLGLNAFDVDEIKSFPPSSFPLSSEPLICERYVGDLAYATTSSLSAIYADNTTICRHVKDLSVRSVEANTTATKYFSLSFTLPPPVFLSL